jgi:hypothetical protein
LKADSCFSDGDPVSVGRRSDPDRAPEGSQEALDLLRALVAKVDGLNARLNAKVDALLARGRRPADASLSRADRARLDRMLPAIAGAHGSKKKSARDLAEDDAPAVRLVVRGLSTKAISKLFGRAEGIPINGLMVRCAGTEFRVALWQVVACAVPGSFKLPETLHDRRASGSIDVGEPDA